MNLLVIFLFHILVYYSPIHDFHTNISMISTKSCIYIYYGMYLYIYTTVSPNSSFCFQGSCHLPVFSVSFFKIREALAEKISQTTGHLGEAKAFCAKVRSGGNDRRCLKEISKRCTLPGKLSFWTLLNPKSWRFGWKMILIFISGWVLGKPDAQPFIFRGVSSSRWLSLKIISVTSTRITHVQKT